MPKALLHDHLDGGLRPATILELADAIGHKLPTADVDELVAWFRRGADAGNILQYLETFAHTVPLLQSSEALRRVATEAAVDLAADGVVYAELRFAPELHPGVGSLDDAIEAVLDGFDSARRAGTDIHVNTIVCAMRTGSRSLEVAEAAARWFTPEDTPGVVAFDLAGAETGFPPSDHVSALELIGAAPIHLTIHASEPPGLELIEDALRHGAERIGHGVRLIEDCLPSDTESDDDTLSLGPLATEVLDRQIPLELCPSCNVQIGAVPTLSDHPIGPFLRQGFSVSVNTDNRLMSGVSVSSEVHAVAEAFDLEHAEVLQLQRNAIHAAFASDTLKARLLGRINAHADPDSI